LKSERFGSGALRIITMDREGMIGDHMLVRSWPNDYRDSCPVAVGVILRQPAGSGVRSRREGTSDPVRACVQAQGPQGSRRLRGVRRHRPASAPPEIRYVILPNGVLGHMKACLRPAWHAVRRRRSQDLELFFRRIGSEEEASE